MTQYKEDGWCQLVEDIRDYVGHSRFDIVYRCFKGTQAEYTSPADVGINLTENLIRLLEKEVGSSPAVLDFRNRWEQVRSTLRAI
jgi:hypothetical protein